jgi:hypothetical protein
MTPVGTILTLLFSVMAFALPRSTALLGVVGATCYVTQYQMVNLGGFHMHAIRIVCLVALMRTAIRGELAAIRFNAIDKNVVVYCLVSSVVYIVRERSGDAVVAELGFAYNLLVPYFAFRALITTYEDFTGFLSKAALFIVPLAILMSFEARSGESWFSGFGDEYRDGHYRCAGAFRSPITGGTFGATLLPLFAGLWFTSARPFAIIGMCAAADIVVCSRSSGPLLACGAGFLGLFFWKYRLSMSKIRRGFVLTIIALHFYMKAPVWFLMGRISDVVGGGGYHRAEIVDAAVNNFRSWWFWGTNETGGWVGTELTFGGADLTNQFVVEGVHGGLVALGLFIWIIVRCFRAIGVALDNTVEELPEAARLIWAMGAALLATVVNFFSVSYFDQIQVVWLLLLAAIVSVTSALGAQDSRVASEDSRVASGEASQELEDSQAPEVSRSWTQ